ncbi:MAG: MGMT family protein [Rhodothalassiaceae bacterium]
MAPPSALIHALVREIPAGQVASYGQVADYLPGVTARQVGRVLAGSSPEGQSVPWHRVINAAGTISAHPGSAEQYRRLQAEGILFDRRGRLDWSQHRWPGPSHVWLLSHGLDPPA